MALRGGATCAEELRYKQTLVYYSADITHNPPPFLCWVKEVMSVTTKSWAQSEALGQVYMKQTPEPPPSPPPQGGQRDPGVFLSDRGPLCSRVPSCTTRATVVLDSSVAASDTYVTTSDAYVTAVKRLQRPLGPPSKMSIFTASSKRWSQFKHGAVTNDPDLREQTCLTKG